MSNEIIAIKVKTEDLDKNRFYKGRNGTYIDLVITPMREPGQYGDTHIVTQSATKEERAQKVRMPIVGNGKVIYKFEDNSGPLMKRTQPTERQMANQTDDDTDVPF
jgi:hypothetical protein